MSIAIKTYYKDSLGNELCFQHAVLAVAQHHQDVTEHIDVQEVSDNSIDSCFGFFYCECVECNNKSKENSNE